MSRRFNQRCFVSVSSLLFFLTLATASDLASFQSIPFNSIQDVTFIANGAGLANMQALDDARKPHLAFYQMDIPNEEYIRLPQLELDFDTPGASAFSRSDNITTWETILKSTDDGSFVLAAIWTQNGSEPSSYPSFQSLIVFYWNVTARKYDIFDRVFIELQGDSWVPVSLDAVVARGNLSTILAMVTESSSGSLNTRVMTYSRMGGSYLPTRVDYYYNTNSSEPRSLTLSPDGGAYATAPGWSTGFVVLRDMNTGNVLTTTNTTMGWGTKPYTMALLRGGRYLIVGDPTQNVVWGAAYDYNLGTYDPATLQPFYLPAQPISQISQQLGYKLTAVEGDSPVTWWQNSGIANCGSLCNVVGTAELLYNVTNTGLIQTPAAFVWQYDVDSGQWVPWVNPLLPFGPASSSQTSTHETITQSSFATVSSTNFITLATESTGIGVYWRGDMTGAATNPLAWNQLSPSSLPSAQPMNTPAPKKTTNWLLVALQIVAIACLIIAGLVILLVAVTLCVKHVRLNKASKGNNWRDVNA